MPQLYAAFFFIINSKPIRKYKPDETDDFIVLLIMVGCQKTDDIMVFSGADSCP